MWVPAHAPQNPVSRSSAHEAVENYADAKEPYKTQVENKALSLPSPGGPPPSPPGGIRQLRQSAQPVKNLEEDSLAGDITSPAHDGVIQGKFIYANNKSMSETALREIIEAWAGSVGMRGFFESAREEKEEVFETWFEKHLPNETIRESIRAIALKDSQRKDEITAATEAASISASATGGASASAASATTEASTSSAATAAPGITDKKDALIAKITGEDKKKVWEKAVKNGIEYATCDNEEFAAQIKDILNEQMEAYLKDFSLSESLDYAIHGALEIDISKKEGITQTDLENIIETIIDSINGSLRTSENTDVVTAKDLEGFASADEQSEEEKNYYKFSETRNYNYKKGEKITGVSDLVKKRIINILGEMVEKAGGDFDQSNPDYHKFLSYLTSKTSEIRDFLLAKASPAEIDALGRAGILAGLINIQTTNAIGFDCHAKMMANMIVRLG